MTNVYLATRGCTSATRATKCSDPPSRRADRTRGAMGRVLAKVGSIRGMHICPTICDSKLNYTHRSHIFDGQTTHGETAAFQLCDLHDEFLRELVENEDDLREVCDVRPWLLFESLRG